jgi:hypothetical protein
VAQPRATSVVVETVESVQLIPIQVHLFITLAVEAALLVRESFFQVMAVLVVVERAHL